MRFDADYIEILSLFDGTRAELRLIRPEDAPLLQAGFSALSPRTRYLRFFAQKRDLSDREARTLSELDGTDNLAVGAIGAPGTAIAGIPMGVARFARPPGGAVEAAVVVVDAFQGKGLGLALLRRLGRAARERGIEALVFETLADNRPLMRLVQKAFPSVTVGPVEEGTVTLRACLDPEAPPTSSSAHVAIRGSEPRSSNASSGQN